jgi:hypothetical protein
MEDEGQPKKKLHGRVRPQWPHPAVSLFLLLAFVSKKKKVR